MTQEREASRPKRRWWRRIFRSAETGQFVTEEYAEEHPDETVGERQRTE